jgi:hypothetical protein
VLIQYPEEKNQSTILKKTKPSSKFLNKSNS